MRWNALFWGKGNAERRGGSAEWRGELCVKGRSLVHRREVHLRQLARDRVLR